MQEIELKFQIPQGQLEAVRAELARLGARLDQPLILQAAYFDTPDRKLAQARSALRVRREGDEWVQTLKAAGSHTMLRVEDNHPASAPAPGQALRPDLGRHRGGPAEAALSQALDWQPAQDPSGAHTGLIELYRTDMARTRATLTVGVGTPHEGVVELALDEGAILAGPLSQPVRELEIELISGHPQAVIEAGQDFVLRFGLWLDTQTKAHRGDRLARLATEGRTHAAPQATLPQPVRLPQERASGLTIGVAARSTLEQVLGHLTANMSELASCDAGTAGDVAYQWRRGLRRLRALSLLLGAHLPLPDAALPRAAMLSRQLGHWRDQVALGWVPAYLAHLGLPAESPPVAPLPADAPDSPEALARSATATLLCLDLLTALVSHADAKHDDAFVPWLSERLHHWHQPLHARARRPQRLSLSALHRLRRRARQLRDMLDLFAPVWPGERMARYRQVLDKTVGALGALQDNDVARLAFRAQAEHDLVSRCAAHWLKVRQAPLRKQAQRALRRWRQVKSPW